MNARTIVSAVDWDAVCADLRGLNLVTAPAQRKQLSKDFYWYSPILTAQLAGCVADLVVKVSTEDDVRQAAAVAAKWKLPLTVRAGGTGNYGQCVPLEGGIVLDVTQMCRVLDIQPGSIRVEAGARMHDIDLAARETGQALRMWPSTWHVASIGGFIAGGFGGIGSFRHGILRDPGNLLRARVMTVEREPRVIELNNDLLAIWREHRFSVVFVTHSVYESVYLSNRIVVMAARPGRVIDEIRIDEPYPRGEDFRTSTRYNAHCTAVSQSLHGALHGVDIDH